WRFVAQNIGLFEKRLRSPPALGSGPARAATGLVGARRAGEGSLAPYRLSIRFAARQMSISGVTQGRLRTGGRPESLHFFDRVIKPLPDGGTQRRGDAAG